MGKSFFKKERKQNKRQYLIHTHSKDRAKAIPCLWEGSRKTQSFQMGHIQSIQTEEMGRCEREGQGRLVWGGGCRKQGNAGSVSGLFRQGVNKCEYSAAKRKPVERSKSQLFSIWVWLYFYVCVSLGRKWGVEGAGRFEGLVWWVSVTKREVSRKNSWVRGRLGLYPAPEEEGCERKMFKEKKVGGMSGW